MITALFMFAVLLTALLIAIRRGLPKPFPWAASLALLMVYLLGALRPLGTFNRGEYFAMLLAGVILGAPLTGRINRHAKTAALLLAIVIILDANRLLPIVDYGNPSTPLLWMRRPYAVENANNTAAWLLLLPQGWWTPITLFITQSRGALVGWILTRRIPTRWLAPAILAGALLLGLAVAVRPGTVLDRSNIWMSGIRAWQASPIIGWGTGAYYNAIYQRTGTPALMDSAMFNMLIGWDVVRLHHAHNAAITMLAENGLIGLAALGWWLASLWRMSALSTHPARWGLLGLAIQQAFDDNWLHPVTSLLIGLMLAVVLAEAQKPGQPAEHKAPIADGAPGGGQ